MATSTQFQHDSFGWNESPPLEAHQLTTLLDCDQDQDPEQPPSTDITYAQKPLGKSRRHQLNLQTLSRSSSTGTSCLASFFSQSHPFLILSCLLCILLTLIILLISTNQQLLFNSRMVLHDQDSTHATSHELLPSLSKQQNESKSCSEKGVLTRNITLAADVETTTGAPVSQNYREELVKEKEKVKELELRIAELLAQSLSSPTDLTPTNAAAANTTNVPSLAESSNTSLPALAPIYDLSLPRLRFPHRIEAHPNFVAEANELGNYSWYFDQYDQEEYSFVNSPIEQPWYQPTVNGSIEPSDAVGQFPFDVSSRRFLSAPEAYQKYNHALDYDPATFYPADVPILWSDTYGAAHWNREAERQFYHLFREQQQPAFQGRPCHERRYVILDQKGKGSGLFSRIHVAIALIQFAHLTGRELILTNREMTMSHSSDDDYLHEGINRYFMPLSECASSFWYQAIERDVDQRSQWFEWKSPLDAFSDAMNNVQFIYLSRWNDDNWKTSSVAKIHSPFRKHLFAYGPTLQHPQRYPSQAAMMLDRTQHQSEHIYVHPSPVRPMRNSFWTEGQDSSYSRQDRVFLDFTLYMFTLWIWAPMPRIQLASRALKQYWSSKLIDQEMSQNADSHPSIPEIKSHYGDGLSHTVSIQIRRGDKCIEDPYCREYQFFHDLGLVGYTMERRAQLNGRRFKSVFFMSDDADVTREVVACSQVSFTSLPDINWSNQTLVDPRLPPSRPSGCRSYASEVAFTGLTITSNPNSTPSCSDPFTRWGFENFLISINYIVSYSEFAIGHTSSNVGRMIQELLYSQRQVDQQLESLFTVYEDTVDNFMGRNFTG